MRTLILTSMLILLHIKLANFATSCKHEEMGAEMVRQKEIESLRESIKQLESSGRYHVRGASGEYGAYQFMPETWRRWSVKYAGQILDIENSQNQDAVAKFKISTLVDEGYTSAQIAAFWNSGLFYGWESLVGINKHGVRYDVPGYVESVLERI